MELKRRVLLSQNEYHVVFDLSYKKSIINKPKLCLNNKSTYWDSGNVSEIIEKIEENYNLENMKKYDEDISFMADILYIYEHIPFLKGIINKSLNEECYISKKEIDKYIKVFNKKINQNKNFKLSNESTWNI